MANEDKHQSWFFEQLQYRVLALLFSLGVFQVDFSNLVKQIVMVIA